MTSLQEKANKYNCFWLISYLKELLSNKDLKTYNRVKCLVYYFPDILYTPNNEFRTAMKYADETYICLGVNDLRHKGLDRFYKSKHNGEDFEPPTWGENRYLTIEDVCTYFKI